MAHRRRFASTSGSTSGSSSDEDPELELDSVSEYCGDAPGLLLRWSLPRSGCLTGEGDRFFLLSCWCTCKSCSCCNDLAMCS